EPQEEGGERLQRGYVRVRLRKEEPGKDQGRRGTVEEEVVPLDGRADEAGDGGLQDLVSGVLRWTVDRLWHPTGIGSLRPAEGSARPVAFDLTAPAHLFPALATGGWRQRLTRTVPYDRLTGNQVSL